MKEELYINGKDAYTTWGISMDNNALSELMTPSSNKTFIENESRLEIACNACPIAYCIPIAPWYISQYLPDVH